MAGCRLPSFQPYMRIIDSGAAHHVYNDRAQFSTFGRLSMVIDVLLGTGQSYPPLLTLRLCTGASIVLEAFYAPDRRQSVSKLAHLHHSQYRRRKCHRDVELLRIDQASVYELASAVQADQGASAERWHQRLAHLGGKW